MHAEATKARNHVFLNIASKMPTAQATGTKRYFLMQGCGRCSNCHRGTLVSFRRPRAICWWLGSGSRDERKII